MATRQFRMSPGGSTSNSRRNRPELPPSSVTVTTAVGGVEVGGSGATSINFVTRQGTNRFSGSAYEYYRDTWMNTNYWFNKRDGLEKNDVQLNQYGARIGGPIVIPKVWDGRGKAFFFVHHEELRLPNDASRDRGVLHPSALTGVFRYNTSSGVRALWIALLRTATTRSAS